MGKEVRIQAPAPAPPMAYNIGVEGDGYSILINWGEEPGWATRLREQLDNAARLSLIPKDPCGGLPVVTVVLDTPRRWITFSRVYGRLNTTTGAPLAAIRLYAIGWQATIGGRNVKSITWVYPNGAIEVADDPTFAGLFLDAAQARSDEQV